MVVKSPNRDKQIQTSPTRASEYSTVNANHVVIKCLNSNKILITSPTSAAKCTTMNTVNMSVISPNSGENFITSSASTYRLSDNTQQISQNKKQYQS